MTATTTSSLAPLGSVLAAALVSLAGMAIVHDPHFELRVWLAPDTGGVVVGGRF